MIAPREIGQPRREVVDGIGVHRYRPTRERRAKLGFLIEFANAWLWTAALSAFVFVREGFAAVQTCNPPDIFFPVALAYKALGCPIVFDQHDLSPELYVARYGESDGLIFRGLLTLERLTYRVADHVIAVSEPWARTAMTRGRKPAEAVTIVSNGPRLADSVPREQRADLREGKAHLCCWVGDGGGRRRRGPRDPGDRASGPGPRPGQLPFRLPGRWGGVRGGHEARPGPRAVRVGDVHRMGGSARWCRSTSRRPTSACSPTRRTPVRTPRSP